MYYLKWDAPEFFSVGYSEYEEAVLMFLMGFGFLRITVSTIVVFLTEARLESDLDFGNTIKPNAHGITKLAMLLLLLTQEPWLS